MKQVLFNLFISLVITPGFAQHSQAELGVAAIGLVVTDIDASEKFYSEIVGMVPAGGFELDSKWSKEAGAANDRPFSVKMFKMKNKESATVLKLAYFDEMAPRPPQSGVDIHAGVNYLTFNYTRAEFVKLAQRLEKTQTNIIGWVKRESYQLIFIHDPDGVFVELVGPPDQ